MYTYKFCRTERTKSFCLPYLCRDETTYRLRPYRFRKSLQWNLGNRRNKESHCKRLQIHHIDEVWHFASISKYDEQSKSGGVFTEYVNTFLKIKQESSGMPSWCTTDDLKQKYIDDYCQRDGILLDPSKIKNKRPKGP